METIELSVETGSRPCTDLTDPARSFVRDAGGGDGLLSIFLPHATAGVALIELGAGSDDDLVRTLGEVLPRDDRWRHAHGARGHGADHVLPAIVSPSMTIPVVDGEMTLGTWQSVVLIDLNRDNPTRRVRLSLLRCGAI